MCLSDLSRYGLTPRERQCVEHIARGLEIKEIARELGIGYPTVKMRVRYAKYKLRARNQIEVAIIAHGGVPQSHQRVPPTDAGRCPVG